jgi:hypothetical protein
MFQTMRRKNYKGKNKTWNQASSYLPRLRGEAGIDPEAS